MLKKAISIIGLGKLGLCLGACFARKGFKVIGIDNNPKALEAAEINPEPGLQNLLHRYNKQLDLTIDYTKAINQSDITFLVLPTPSLKDGHFDLSFLKSALKKLAIDLKENPKRYHVFVIVSTVSPNSIDEQIIPLIEKYSSLKINQGFGVCYNPAFVALGQVIEGFIKPDLELIGQSDAKTGLLLENLKKHIFAKMPAIVRMSLTSAEITKISLNSYITMKISFINNLADLCTHIPNANIKDIAHALGQDKRISPYYLKPGLGFGGPCFPRDNKAFTAFAQRYLSSPLNKAAHKINKDHTALLIKNILKHIPQDCKTIAIIGLSYKPDTPVMDGSNAIDIIEHCLAKGFNIIGYDALAMANARALFGKRIRYASSLEECLEQSSCWIFTQSSKAYQIPNKKGLIKNQTLIDCWGSMPYPRPSKIKYIVPFNPHQDRIPTS